MKLRDGTPLMCKVTGIQNGATMVSFCNPQTSLPCAEQERFAISDHS